MNLNPIKMQNNKIYVDYESVKVEKLSTHLEDLFYNSERSRTVELHLMKNTHPKKMIVDIYDQLYRISNMKNTISSCTLYN